MQVVPNIDTTGLVVRSKINQNIFMKSQLKKELKKININSQSLFKSPLKIFKKINLDNLKKVTFFSLTEEYKEFKKKKETEKKR